MAPKPPGCKKNKAKKIAMSGVFSALSIVILLVGGIFPLATFSAPVFAGVVLLPLAVELGGKTALIAYVAVCIISSLLVPDRELVLFFVMLFGYYPILQPYISKIKNRVLRTSVKLLLFNLSVALIYTLLLVLFTTPQIAQEFSGTPLWILACMLLLANLTFMVYNVMVDRLRLLYVLRIRRRLYK